jgi:signal transduction histidine kinase
MKSYDGTDEVLRGYVAASENTAMRLKHLSDDMFKYSLAFGGSEGGVKLEEYDATTLFEQLLAEHILLMNENGFNMSLDFDEALRDGEYSVYTDAPNLMRIIDNLFSNLTKYADKTYPVTLSVKLNGYSLTVECKNRISRNADAAESNGIGLKTCKRLASLVAEGFEYSDDGEYFTTKLSLKLHGKA